VNETAFERVIDALQDQGCKVSQRGGERAESTCPAHDDHNASLSITGIHGQTLIYCHAGCDYRDVLAAMQLSPADLYDEKSETYRYDDGRTVKRFYDERGKKRFAQTGAGPQSTLYHRHRLAAVEPGTVCIHVVEGEKDVHAIEAAGGVATTAPQGADSFHKVDVSPLAGHNVAVVVDRDEAGMKWAAQVFRKLLGVAKAVRFFRAKTGKDAADHVAAGYGLDEFERFDPFATEFGDYFDGQAALVPLANGTLVLPSREARELERAADAELLRLKARYLAEERFRAEQGSRPVVGTTYGDVMTLLDGGLPEPPAPQVLYRMDGVALLYRNKVNVLYGDSESGKTWIALAAIASDLCTGGRAAFVDLDHNGMAEIVTRLLALGAPAVVLRDQDRFRYCEPGDALELEFFVKDIAAWGAGVTVVDSVGEVLPMLGLSSNSPDDYTFGNRKTLTPLAESGACVIAIDHLPKDPDARQKGQTGTLAKKRAINGVSLRVTAREQFTPGVGGASDLTIDKDRPGGLRGHCPPGRNAPAGRFVMNAAAGNGLAWYVTTPPAAGPERPVPDEDIAAVLGLPEDQRTKRKVQAQLKWGSDRAYRALKRCRELGEYAPED